MTSTAPGAQRRTGEPPELAPGARWRRVFPGEERQLGVMRRWLGTLLPGCPARSDLVLVADELCSNAIRHTASGHTPSGHPASGHPASGHPASGHGGRFTVEIAWHEPVFRVAVADEGGPAEPQVIDDPSAEHGRGLLLVRGLSARIGIAGDHRGRTIWADVPWDGPAPAAATGTHEATILGSSRRTPTERPWPSSAPATASTAAPSSGCPRREALD